MYDTFLMLFTAALAAVAVVSLMSLPPISWWPLELVSHFRVQYSAILGVGSLAVALGGETYVAGIFAVVGLINFLPVAPFLPLRTEEQYPHYHKLVLVNVRMRNRAFELLARLLEVERPDLIGLVEVDDDWLGAIDPHLERRGYVSISAPRDDSYGLAVYSRFKIVSRSPAELGNLNGSSLSCTISCDKQKLNILVLHIPPPLTPQLLKQRDRALQDVGDWLQGSAGEWIVMGDFNMSPWSRSLRETCKQANLQSFRDRGGVRATWPDQFAPVRIPIDHVLGTKCVVFGYSKVGMSVGSDHLPVVVRFRLNNP